MFIYFRTDFWNEDVDVSKEKEFRPDGARGKVQCDLLILRKWL